MIPKAMRLPKKATEIRVNGEHNIFVFDRRGVRQRADGGGKTGATHFVKPGQRVLIHLPSSEGKPWVVVIPGAGSTVEGSGIEALHKDIFHNTNTLNGFVSEHPNVRVKPVVLSDEVRKAMAGKILHTL